MKTTLRTLTALLLCMILCCCLSAAASAETVASGDCGAQGNNLTWTLDDAGTLTISGAGAMEYYEQGTAPWYGNRLSINAVVMEDGVMSIGDYAFYFLFPDNLISVTIPASVTSIGNYAFEMYNSLAVVYYGGTESQWDSIAIGSGNRNLTNALRFYNGETPAVCTITIDPNGATGGSMSPMTVETNKTATLKQNNYWWQNHTFIGWKDQNGKGYADEGTLTPTEDLTLYAQWRRTAYSIRYEPNGGGGSAYTQNVSVGKSTSVLDNEFNIPFGQMFAGWNTKADGSGTALSPGTTITPTGDLTLYAQWREALTIRYYPGDAEGSATSVETPLGYPVKPTASSLGFTANEGEIFLGWLIEGDDTLHKAGEEVVFDSVKNVTAQWTKRIKVTYDQNGGSGTRKVQYIPMGIPAKLAKMSLIGYTRTGFEFAGWGLTPYIDPDSPNIIPDGAEVNFAYDMELYAIWRQKAFVGTVELFGDKSDYEDRAYFGETLTAEISGESLFTVFTYQWLRDGTAIPDATKVSYVVGEMDFGHSLSCAVTAVDAPENAVKVSYNTKFVGIDEEEKQIVDSGLTEIDAIRGLTPDMTYSIDGGLKQPVSLDSQGRMPVTQQGIYQFYKNDVLVGTVKVVNWYSLSYSIMLGTASPSSSSSSSSSSSGAGTVLIRYGSVQLTASSQIKDTNGNVIIKGNGTNSWLVRDGANLTGSIIMTVRPTNCYAHVSLNDGEYSSYAREALLAVSPVTGPMQYRIVFSQHPDFPPLPVAVIDETAFPDPAFRRYVLSNIDWDGDGVLYSEEIDRTYSISCSNYGIKSLQGIEVFDKLSYLYCEANSLTELDLSGCPSLLSLSCIDNALTELDLSGCPMLTSLYCSSNALTELNLGNCSGLTTLDCSGNLLATLDLSGNPQLQFLNCYDNLIRGLNLSGNTALTIVYCYGNLLSELDVSGLTALTTLSCDGNLLKELDLSGCGALRTLNCSGNDLMALELDGCVSLTTLDCYQNGLTNLDLSTCDGLRRLRCANNRLSALDFRGYPSLTTLSCQNNELTELHVSGCAALKALTCEHNALTELELNGCDALLTLMENVEPTVSGGVVTYGVGSTGSPNLSHDEGVALHNTIPDPDFILPASLTVIEPEAFAGGAFVYVVVPEQVSAIGSRAFADCPNLRYVEIQGSATEIAPDAFENVSDLTILDRSGGSAAG